VNGTEYTDVLLDSRLRGMVREGQARGPVPAGVLVGEMHADTASAGFAALHPPYVSTRRDVQRGSPPQADAEGLGVSPNSPFSLLKIGGQEVEDSQSVL